MGLFDVTGFKDNNQKENMSRTKNKNDGISDSSLNNKYNFEESGFDETILNIDDIDSLIMYKVINDKFSLRKLLENMGYDLFDGNIFCPFHMDELTGKPSARYHKDTDLLYCFSENKVFSAYHALKILYGRDMKKLFKSIWIKLPRETRESYLNGTNQNNDCIKQNNLLWEKYKDSVLVKFKENKVLYRQYKHALYMILDEVSKDEQQNLN